MNPIALAGFADKFAGDHDPWSTWTDPDEALKRRAILHGLPPGPVGRLLELGAGNGSNSRSLARHALRLDATEATGEGTALVERAIVGARGARAMRLVVPARPPRAAYDAIVIAELLYYLDARAMQRLAEQVAAVLRVGGTLVLAHHRITFYDFAQHADGIHDRFLRQTGVRWQCGPVLKTGRWAVATCRRQNGARTQS
ncbi:SAM-dependent methyltransferase [Sphingomonas nostoxanthinifaciens]|uniref:SAM-dependent methyltransferase n=1 Tax=Sphingomonas nostoxanthinifaciens TaxID=2872652 RepID=UPI001CC208BD|nr:class I SAM-dependent methyltransferase [Sphingomonas nostoxanthinifaciens]UAK23228.1 class I SAM-dependent methyltransferase [Sphingomonas nostoxanthinifaciens]